MKVLKVILEESTTREMLYNKNNDEDNSLNVNSVDNKHPSSQKYKQIIGSLRTLCDWRSDKAHQKLSRMKKTVGYNGQNYVITTPNIRTIVRV